MNTSRRFFALLGCALLFSACASIKAPSVRVAGIHLDGVSLTGARVDVGLDIRNMNPEALQIERFEYEIKLNGKTLGRGFQSEPLMLGGFKEDRVVSRLDIDLLKIPAAVLRILDRDRVDAQVKGVFYVLEGSDLRKIKFGARGNVDLNKIRSPDSKE